MKRIILAAALLPASLLVMAFFNPTTATRVKFMGGDWETAESKAKSEKKIYFVDFDASYCASCRNMDESTYQDAALASFIEQKVVALRLDVQDFDGVMWSQKYEVEALPTMLIFNEEGKLVKRLVGYKSAKDLLSAFQEAEKQPSTRATGHQLANNANTAPQPIHEDKPVLTPVLSTRKTTTTTTTPPTNTPTHSELLNPRATGPSGKGLYELALRRAKSEGFTVQLGVFSSMDVMMEQADKATQKFSNQKTMVHLDEINGQQVFKLLMGNFANKRDASVFRESLRKAGMDGIIKDMSGMK